MNVFDIEDFKEKIALSDLDELEELQRILDKEIELEYKAVEYMKEVEQ